MDANFNDFGMGGHGLMFQIFPILFFLMFVLVIGVFIFTFIKSAKQWNKNNHSPTLIVDAKVVVKRTDITHHHDAGENHTGTHSSTWYYATFQVESGDRMEFTLSGEEYGMLAEGDSGKLTFQGTRFHRFERQ